MKYWWLHFAYVYYNLQILDGTFLPVHCRFYPFRFRIGVYRRHVLKPLDQPYKIPMLLLPFQSVDSLEANLGFRESAIIQENKQSLAQQKIQKHNANQFGSRRGWIVLDRKQKIMPTMLT